MDEIFAEKLLNAIKNDNLDEFDALIKRADSLALRFGRFPVLSALYLFDSHKIVAAYEPRLLKASSWQEIPEPSALSNAFRKKAGKCMRLYIGEIVSPLEMLLVLDKTARVKRLYSETGASNEVKSRLKSIYRVKYALEITYAENAVVIPRRPLTFGEKKRILTACISVILCIAVAVGTPFAVNAFVPFIGVNKTPETPPSFDFGSNDPVIIDKDTVFGDGGDKSAVNIADVLKDATADVDGGGKTLTFKGSSPMFSSFKGTLKNATLNIESKAPMFSSFNGRLENVTVNLDESGLAETLTGALENCIINTKGKCPVAEIAEASASIENVTVNVNADATVKRNSSFLVGENYGLINKVTLNAAGTASFAVEDGEAGIVFGGIAGVNGVKMYSLFEVYRGQIKDCVANYGIRLAGEVRANTAFGGIVGANNSVLTACKVYGTENGGIEADTVDVAGICAENTSSLTYCENHASITQRSEEKDWNPIVSGIVINNTYEIAYCTNYGNLTSVSECGALETDDDSEPSVYACGIAQTSYNLQSVNPYTTVTYCVNKGNVTATADYRSTYAAGICGTLIGEMNRCINDGAVKSVTGGSGTAMAGGLGTVSYGTAYYAVARGDVLAEAREGTAYCGGIYAIGGVTVIYNTVYSGRIYQSVATCGAKIDSNKSESLCGGLVGKINEFIAGAGTEREQVFGGGISGACFAGTAAKTGSATVGGLCGGIGKNIHDKNEYVSYGNTYKFIEGNFCLTDGEALAFAARVSYGEQGTAELEAGSDLETTKGTAAELKENETLVKLLSTVSTAVGETVSIG